MSMLLDDTEQRLHDEIVSEVRQTAGAEAFDAAWAVGSRQMIEDVIDEAIALVRSDSDDS